MKVCLIKCLVTLVLLTFPGLVAVRAQSPRGNADPPLTNGSIVQLVRAGFREKTVIAIISSRPVRFDLAPDRLIELKKSGVAEKIILAMLARDEGLAISDELWSEDPFFNDSGGIANSDRADNRRGDPGDNSTDIFGMSGGSRGRTRSGGRDGSSDGETLTTGSATVRILRPPTEAGAAAPKLERTPTLTNEGVVQLVEAGFSEGTIVRRIEQSPADYDLTPPKLAELRRRRVGDRIIAAMRAAMGEDAQSSSAPSNAAPEK